MARDVAERRTRRSIAAGLEPLGRLAAIWAIAAALLLGLFEQNAVPPEALLLDPSAYNRLPWYTGLVSNLGILGWTVAATAAATGARLGRLAGRDSATRFLRAGAMLGILLLLDDLFQLHVVVAQQLGIDKASFYGLYGLLGLGWIVEHRAEALRTRWALLIASGLVLGGSGVIDQVLATSATALIMEDALKFLGILAWAQYFVLTTTDIARSIVDQQAADRPVEPGSPPSPSPATSAVAAGATAGAGGDLGPHRREGGL